MKALGTRLDSRGCSEASLWRRISEANSMFSAKKALFCDPKRLRCVIAGEWASTQSMFQALRIWELGKLRRVMCLRRRPNECWADHVKRTSPIVVRQLKKHGQPRLQTLAMRCVRIAAWQMVRCPNDAKVRRYWEVSATRRCDEIRREAYIKLSKKDYRNRNALFLVDQPTGNALSRVSLGM